MGTAPNVSFDTFPKQGEGLGKKHKVVFNYDTSRFVEAICVRDDVEEPYRMLFEYEHPVTGEKCVVLATECQYQPMY